MKILVLKMTILAACGIVSGQTSDDRPLLRTKSEIPIKQTAVKLPTAEDVEAVPVSPPSAIAAKKPEKAPIDSETPIPPFPPDTDLPDVDDKPALALQKFHWKPAVAQSLIFLGIQHGARMTQAKTRHGLRGPFFRDWKDSVSTLNSWGDDGLFFTNYIAHPLQGGVTGRIFVNNSDNAKRQEFGVSKEYWKSRMKAMAWSAFWSTQFEIGPVSEASLGNVGMEPVKYYGKMGWNDIVVTPVLGTGVVVAEDAIEKYVLRNWLERKLTSRTRIKIWRTVLTPTTSFSNILRGKMPWKRDDRD